MKYICPVCGYPDLHEPAYDEYECASFEICPSCGIEFGYQDAAKSHEELRREWQEKGTPWHSQVVDPPYGWNAIERLNQAGLLHSAAELDVNGRGGV